MDELLTFARQLGSAAGRLLLDYHGRAAASEKWDGTVVTEADRAADRLICQAIRERYPDHAVLSEEAETAYAGRRYTWVVDPLDGTTNYALGVCYWCCSIALVADGQPRLGVLTAPMLNAEYWALRGRGAFLNGTQLGGPPRGVSERNSFLAICSRSWKNLDIAVPYKGRMLGSAALDLAAVAQGIAVGCTQVVSHIWDLAAGWLLAQEAGRAVGPLFPGVPDPFPMQPGAEYGRLVFPLAAAADEPTFQNITSRVTVKAGAQERFRAWASAGWDKKVWRMGMPDE